MEIILIVRDRPKLFRNNFRFLPSSYFHSTGPNESTRTKNQSRSSLLQKNAILSRLKLVPHTLKVWNRNFCQARMIVYDHGYLLLGRFVASTLAEKNHKNIENQELFQFFEVQLYIFLDLTLFFNSDYTKT